MSDLVDLMAALRQDAEERSVAQHRAVRDDEAAGRRPGTPELLPENGLGPLVGDSLRSTLRRRKANRFFADQPVDADVLRRMVEAGHGADASLWPVERAARPLEFLVAARDVTGLRPAVHRHEPDGFTPLADLAGTGELSALVLQPEFALAPAILVAVGSLEDATDSAGSHGHRLLLERSGAACAAAWLTAVDAGLSGSIFAGFLPSALRRLVGIDGFRRTQLLALAVGQAREPSDEYGGRPVNA
ncbi:nitroreductase family protein [Kitasatospora sp. SUK 42]|uniref:nitroreductase family protein n=1 Tax=Kitasatospora sp. SUK 42 TaxID=1588882 RepID=UPI0018CB8855|nr:nitroreductase family protein [Kitasatospora sp. SUK 42]MBV2153699.1 nitroreductase family protein [Kitasatospora sp. SUK 42]